MYDCKFSLFVEDTPYHVALREALKPIREPVNCGEVARHRTSTGTQQSGYGTGTQRPGRSRSPVGSTILIITARGVSSSPGRTHGTVEVAPDYLPLLLGWRALGDGLACLKRSDGVCFGTGRNDFLQQDSVQRTKINIQKPIPFP